MFSENMSTTVNPIVRYHILYIITNANTIVDHTHFCIISDTLGTNVHYLYKH